MRFRYSSVRAWMAGSLVLPIQAILIFTRGSPIPGDSRNSLGFLLFFLRCGCPGRGWLGWSFLRGGSLRLLRSRPQVAGFEAARGLPQALQVVELSRLVGEH